MRIALTHLRTAILFFSPMVEDAIRDEVRDELKWLNGELGAVRDLDVAVDRIKVLDKKRPQVLPRCRRLEREAQRRPSHARAHAALGQIPVADRSDLGLDRERPVVDQEGQAGRERTRRTDRRLHADKLLEWEEKLLKRSRKLRKMGTKKRHRLRLLNKKLTYSINSLEDLFADKKFAKQKAALKQSAQGATIARTTQ